MDNTWAPIWNSVDFSTWVFLGSHLDVNWVLLGFYLGVTWVSLECHLGVTWVSLALALALKHNTFPAYLIFVRRTTGGACVKKKLPGVIFYRFNAKNWQFTV